MLLVYVSCVIINIIIHNLYCMFISYLHLNFLHFVHLTFSLFQTFTYLICDNNLCIFNFFFLPPFCYPLFNYGVPSSHHQNPFPCPPAPETWCNTGQDNSSQQTLLDVVFCDWTYRQQIVLEVMNIQEFCIFLKTPFGISIDTLPCPNTISWLLSPQQLFLLAFNFSFQKTNPYRVKEQIGRAHV